MGDLIQLPASNHFGDCPLCKGNDGHINIGREHWFICRKHRAKWYVGSNIFPDWQEETAEDWKRNEELLGCFMEIEPFQPGSFASDEQLLLQHARKAHRFQLNATWRI